MAENTEASAGKSEDANRDTEENKADYVSDQLALKVWSVLARELHEGGNVMLLGKAWDNANKDIVLFPSYAGQDPEAIKPDVWMSWRHELKPPMAGHTRIRDCAEVVEAFPVKTLSQLAAIDAHHGLTLVEARRRFSVGEPGLVALVLRVYRLSRSYRFENVAENEGDGEFAPLPFDVGLEDLQPVLEDREFERRLRAIRAALAGS